MKWSKEQKKAIDDRGHNILVSAGAGAGKTTVLVERIRKLISEDGIPVREFLVVTFTNAAAAEMKERLRKALGDEIQGEDPASDKSKYLRKQLADLETSNISTFHSFCLSVIRRFFYKLELEPGFAMGDEIETGILKEEALDNLIEKEFEDAGEDFIAFMDAYSGDRNDFGVRSLILETHNDILSMPDPWNWMKGSIDEIERAAGDFNNSKIWTEVRKEIVDHLERAKDKYWAVSQIFSRAGFDDLAEKIEKNEVAKCEDAIEIAKALSGNAEDILSEIADILGRSNTRLTVPKEYKETYESEIKSVVTELRDAGKKIIDEKVKGVYLNKSANEIFLTSFYTVPYLRTLLRLVKEFDDLYKAAKRERNIIDFSDLEHYCYKVLEDEEVATYYKESISQIFIDEYQDTNLMQDAIIERIRRSNNLFMVGDIKQSIYRFRLAEPDIFQKKYDEYKFWTSDDVDDSSQSITVNLNENHRSSKPVIDYINKVFEPLMKGYDERAKLKFTPDDKIKVDPRYDAVPELRVVTTDVGVSSTDGGDPGEDERDYENLDDLKKEAIHIAGIIKDNIGKPFFDVKADPPAVRPLEAKDIVILRRSVSTAASAYMEVLKEEGIDAVIQGDDGYFDTVEISAFVDLLSVINNIHRDVSLIGVLHSEVFGFSSEELATIRILHRDGSYADSYLDLVNGNFEIEGTGFSSEEVEILLQKVRSSYERIIKWRGLSRSMTLPKFIWELLIESGLYVVMGALPNGARRQANLRVICEMAERYSKGRQVTLFDFLRYIESVKRGDIKVPESEETAGAGAGVRVMTIHKSKGLEFPVVIVSGIGKRLAGGRRGSFYMHKDIGVGLKYVNREENWSTKTMMQNLISSRCSEEDLEEEIRILYVAMTRARSRLYLVGYSNSLSFAELADFGIVKKNSYLGMLAGSVPHRIVAPTYTANDLAADDQAINKEEHFSDDPGVNKISDIRKAEIFKQLDYKYPHVAAKGLKSKYSVSEINKESRKKRDEGKTATTAKAPAKRSIRRRTAKRTASFSAAERGTIYHRIMECIDFSKLYGLCDDELKTSLNLMLDDLMSQGILLREEIDAVDVGKVCGFFDSPLGKRASKAAVNGLLEKERAFTLKMDKDGERVLVQGIIDCYFSEYPSHEGKDGEMGDPATVLIDYKSNWIDRSKPIEEEAERLRRDYKGQLDIYKKALETAGVGPVNEVYLYLLDIGYGFLV